MEILQYINALLNQYYFHLPVALQNWWNLIGITFLILLFFSISNFLVRFSKIVYKQSLKWIRQSQFMLYAIIGKRTYLDYLPNLKRIFGEQLNNKNIGGLVALLQTNWQFKKKETNSRLYAIRRPENLGFCEIIDQDSLVNLAKKSIISIYGIKLSTDKNGEFYILFSLENKSSEKVRCIIPKGQIFENFNLNTTSQNLATFESYVIDLKVGETKRFKVNAYCLNQSFDPPDNSDGRITIFEVLNKNYDTQDDLWRIIQFYNESLNYSETNVSNQKNLTSAIIQAAVQLQGRAKIIQLDEDSRNGFIATVLENKGFIIKDQTRWGKSKSGKSSGEIDIKIENEENEPISICEAFILKALSKKVISEHLIKLFGYDPNGLKRNYILVYSDANKFEPLWKRYLSYIEMVDYPFVLKGAPRDLSHKYSPYSEIKVGLAYHSRSGGLVEVLHIFVNMNHQIN